VINGGMDFLMINQAITMSAGAAHDVDQIVFIVPRNNRTLLPGEMVHPNKLSLITTLILSSPSTCGNDGKMFFLSSKHRG
jgi:hypothetical protein